MKTQDSLRALRVGSEVSGWGFGAGTTDRGGSAPRAHLGTFLPSRSACLNWADTSSPGAIVRVLGGGAADSRWDFRRSELGCGLTPFRILGRAPTVVGFAVRDPPWLTFAPPKTVKDCLLLFGSGCSTGESRTAHDSALVLRFPLVRSEHHLRHQQIGRAHV